MHAHLGQPILLGHRIRRAGWALCRCQCCPSKLRSQLFFRASFVLYLAREHVHIPAGSCGCRNHAAGHRRVTTVLLVLEQSWQLHFSMETGGAAVLSVTKYWAFIEYQLCTLCALLEPVLDYFIPASPWRAHKTTIPLSEKQKRWKTGPWVCSQYRAGLGHFMSMLPSCGSLVVAAGNLDTGSWTSTPGWRRDYG